MYLVTDVDVVPWLLVDLSGPPPKPVAVPLLVIVQPDGILKVLPLAPNVTVVPDDKG